MDFLKELLEFIEKPNYKFGPIRVKTKDEIAKFNDQLIKNGFKFFLDHDHQTNEGLFMFPTKKEHDEAYKLNGEMIAKHLSFTGVEKHS